MAAGTGPLSDRRRHSPVSISAIRRASLLGPGYTQPALVSPASRFSWTVPFGRPPRIPPKGRQSGKTASTGKCLRRYVSCSARDVSRDVRADRRPPLGRVGLARPLPHGTGSLLHRVAVGDPALRDGRPRPVAAVYRRRRDRCEHAVSRERLRRPRWRAGPLLQPRRGHDRLAEPARLNGGSAARFAGLRRL